MDDFLKILLGVLTFVITSTLAYLFRMRQLYVVVPKLYRHSNLSKDGSICEVVVYNKGNQVEEDIVLNIDTNLKCELIASAAGDVTIEDGKLVVKRLHKSKNSSAILMVDNGIISNESIVSISSKATVGRVVKDIDSLPVNYASFFVLIILTCAILFGMFNIDKVMKTYDEYSKGRIVKEFSYLGEKGWSNLFKYSESEIRKSYSNSEFPIYFKNQKKVGKDNYYVFEIFNKTALPIEVSVNIVKDKESILSFEEKYKFFKNYKVDAFEKNEISIPSTNGINLDFKIKFANDFLYGIVFDVNKGVSNLDLIENKFNK